MPSQVSAPPDWGSAKFDLFKHVNLLEKNETAPFHINSNMQTKYN
jgi:hypothetical protein